MVVYWICDSYGWDGGTVRAIDGRTPVLVTTEDKAPDLARLLEELGVRYERLGYWDQLTAWNETRRGLVGLAMHPDSARPHHPELVRRFGRAMKQAEYYKWLTSLPVTCAYAWGPLPDVRPTPEKKLFSSVE